MPPGGRDRTADLVAALAGDWLLVVEVQAQPDPDKLDVTLEEVATLRNRARHGADRKGKYKVVAGLVYLLDRCPGAVLDMTLPDGSGTRHGARVWDVAADAAPPALDAVATGRESWGVCFWVPLMAGGNGSVVPRWREVVSAAVPDRRVRGDLAGVALVFAELAGRRAEWERGLEGFEMTESQVVNGWIRQGEQKGKLGQARAFLLKALDGRFPGAVPAEVVRVISEQESLPLLDDWFQAAVTADTFEQFLAVLKH